MIEPPYGDIADSLMQGDVIPFLGAGASLTGRKIGVQWDPKEPKFLPSGFELSTYLAERSSFPSTDKHDIADLAKVASYYTAVTGRGRQGLGEQLRTKLGKEFPFGSIHQYLASISAPLLIVTTNYDTLLERAFQSAQKEYDLIIYPSDPKKDMANTIWWWSHGASEPESVQPNNLDPELLEKRTVIFKMHGNISQNFPDWDSFVITEEDYINFLSRMATSAAIPAILYQHALTRSFLFLGHGLGDWNMRVILKELDNTLKKSRVYSRNNIEIKSWAIQWKPSELEKKLWSSRKVDIYDMSLDDFVAKMKKMS